MEGMNFLSDIKLFHMDGFMYFFFKKREENDPALVIEKELQNLQIQDDLDKENKTNVPFSEIIIQKSEKYQKAAIDRKKFMINR